MNFNDLNLDPRILQALDEAGFETPTPIQASAIPAILHGADLRASAQTGTGKTAAFLLPALQRLTVPSTKKGMGPRILIVVPTRELAVQVAAEAEKHGKYLQKVKTVCIYGGAPYPVQKRQLSRPYEILVATPGRLIDHLGERRIDLSRLEMLVLDEADRMLDMGFIGPVEEIVAATPASRQTLLFSATLKGQILKLSNALMNNPKEICVIPPEEKYEHIKQDIYYCDHLSHKLELLKDMLTDAAITQALIFTSTKRYAEELAKELREIGHSASALHGDMNQRLRQRTLSKMREGHLRLLVATDVAARGIDISTISHVFNFDLPKCPEDYTHRIGRTGRAGASGVAASFVTPRERPLMKQIEAFLKQKLSSKGGEPAKHQPETNRKQDRMQKQTHFKRKRTKSPHNLSNAKNQRSYSKNRSRKSFKSPANHTSSAE